MQRWKVAMMGGGGVGKSAVALRFVHRQYVETYDPTIEDAYSRSVAVGGRVCLLEIMDTAGIEQYAALNDTYIGESDAFVLVFSVAHEDSVDELRAAHKTILQKRPRRVPMLVLGNKADLAAEREVSFAQGQELAHELGCTYLETSACSNTNIDTVFDTVVRQLRRESEGELVPAKEKRRKRHLFW